MQAHIAKLEQEKTRGDEMSRDESKVSAEKYQEEVDSREADNQHAEDASDPDISISDNIRWRVMNDTAEYLRDANTYVDVIYSLLSLASDVCRCEAMSHIQTPLGEIEGILEILDEEGHCG